MSVRSPANMMPKIKISRIGKLYTLASRWLCEIATNPITRGNLGDFCNRHPLFLGAIALLLGTVTSPIIWLIFLLWRKKALYFAAFCASIWMATTPKELDEGEVKGTFVATTVSFRQGFFKPYYLYRGFFEGVPCSMTLAGKKRRPSGDHLLEVSGRLRKRNTGFYSLHARHWSEGERRMLSLVEIRYSTKKAVKNYLHRWYHKTQARGLITSLTTGELAHPTLGSAFSRVGLSHLLAISGFHFAFIALIFSLLIRPFTNTEGRSLLLIVFLSVYFFFIGPTPSIERVWIAVLAVLVGSLFNYRTTALNTLGLACILSIIRNPLCIHSLSFQLSYLATLGILLFYRTISTSFLYYPTSIALQFSLKDKHYYLLATLLRRLLSVTLSALTLTLPILLYNFHSFPLLTLLYNLFIPPLIVLTLTLSLLGLILPWIFHPIAEFFAQSIVDAALYSPRALQYTLSYTPSLSLTIALTLLPLIALFVRSLLYKNDYLELSELTLYR